MFCELSFKDVSLTIQLGILNDLLLLFAEGLSHVESLHQTQDLEIWQVLLASLLGVGVEVLCLYLPRLGGTQYMPGIYVGSRGSELWSSPLRGKCVNYRATSPGPFIPLRQGLTM